MNSNFEQQNQILIFRQNAWPGLTVGRGETKKYIVLLRTTSGWLIMEYNSYLPCYKTYMIYFKNWFYSVNWTAAAHVVSLSPAIPLRPVQTDATSVNNSQHFWVLLANNVTSVWMGLNVWPVSNYMQQVPTSANVVVVPCKRTQQVTTLLGPTMLGVVGQQCWVRLHGPLTHKICKFRRNPC